MKTPVARKTERKPKEAPEIPVENPMALYSDVVDIPGTGTGTTFMDRFRRFAFRSKASLYLILLISIVGFWAISLRQPGPASTTSLLRAYFERFTQHDASARYRIGAIAVPDSQIAGAFSALLSVNPMSVNQASSDPDVTRDLLNAFQRSQFENDLLLHAAIESGQLDTPEARLFLETVLRQAAADYFVLTNLTPEERKYGIDINEADVQALYKKNGDRYAKAGIEKELALQSIRSALQSERIRQRNEIIAIKRAQMTRTIQEATGAYYREANR
jgi:hypothetical protein